MAKQKAVRAGNTSGFKFEKAGDTLSGYYIGTTEEMINGSLAKKHVFKTATGLVSVLGQADMYKQLVGNDCLNLNVDITFTGQVLKLKGGKTMKLYDVEFDPDDQYDAGASGGHEDYADESEPGEEESPADEIPVARASAPRQPAVVSSAARQEAVRNKLGGLKPKAAS